MKRASSTSRRSSSRNSPWPIRGSGGPRRPARRISIRSNCNSSGRQVSDSSHTDFGIREVTSEIDAQGHRLFHINGKNILIRGAGYTFDMLLRETPERQDAELRYVRDMNLNAVRFEGKLADDHFLELCDRYGILVMAGWCCCDHWEQWQQWDQEDETIAAASLRDQLRRLARHPAVFDWLNGSDNPPPPENREAVPRHHQGNRSGPTPTSPPPPGSHRRHRSRPASR